MQFIGIMRFYMAKHVEKVDGVLQVMKINGKELKIDEDTEEIIQRKLPDMVNFPKEGHVLKVLADPTCGEAIRNAKYRLLSYNRHTGTSTERGHYITYLRSAHHEGKFVCVQDSVTDPKIMQDQRDWDHFEDQAYCLLYERID